MAQIEKKELSQQEWEVHLTIEPQDYLPELKKDLKKINKKVALKGFRKGKVPMGFLRKTYGGNIMSNLISELVHKNIGKLLEENQRQMLYANLPLESEDETNNQIEPQKDKTYQLSFLLSLLPNIELPEKLFENFDTPRYIPEPPETEILSHWKNFLHSVLRQREQQAAESEKLDTRKALHVSALVHTASGREVPIGFTLQMASKAILEKLEGLKNGDEIKLKPNELLPLITEIDQKPASEFKEEISEIFAEGFKILFTKASYVDEEEIKPSPEEYKSYFGEESAVGSKEEALAYIRKSQLDKMADEPASKTILLNQFLLYLNKEIGEQISLPEAYFARRKQLMSDTKTEEGHHRYSVLSELLKKHLEVEVSNELLEEALASKLGFHYLPPKEKKELVKKLYEDSRFNSLITQTYNETEQYELAHALDKKVQPKLEAVSPTAFEELYTASFDQVNATFFPKSKEDEEE